MALTMTPSVPDSLRFADNFMDYASNQASPNLQSPSLRRRPARSKDTSQLELAHRQSAYSNGAGITMQTDASSNTPPPSETPKEDPFMPAAGRLSTSPTSEKKMRHRKQKLPQLVSYPGLPTESTSGMISVTDYTPTEGEGHIPIIVHVELRGNEDGDKFGYKASLNGMKLRLIFGRTAVRTIVNRLVPTGPDAESKLEDDDVLRLRLYATTPDHLECHHNDLKVPLSVQAMDAETEHVETLVFGSFLYWSPTVTIQPAATIELPPPPSRRKRLADDDETLLRDDRMAEEINKEMRLIRTSNIPADLVDDAEPAELEWVERDGSMPPEDITLNWSHQEFAEGRRLVRFSRNMEDNRLQVSCEIIPQEEYKATEEEIVISCIYRAERRDCVFTSVDVIYLLERLVGEPFCVEEKNRIRRNLEGLKPSTVSKSGGASEAFFRHIMGFPPPQPRNIEKDVKVFPWSKLPEAVEKIILKYSVVPQSDVAPPMKKRKVKSVFKSTSPSDSTTTQENTLPGPVITYDNGKGHDNGLEMPDGRVSQAGASATDFIPEVRDGHYYPYGQFTEGEGWNPHHHRSTSMTSNQSIPVVHEEYYGNRPGSLNMHAQALSNPFASEVTLGGMYSQGQSQSQSSLQLQGPGQGLGHPSHGPNAQRDGFLGYNEDGILSRQASGTEAFLYPIHEHPQQELMGGAYEAVTQGQQEVPNDMLYSHFHPSSNSNLASDDVIEQHA